MRVALICNTISAFPLLHWLDSQGILAGVGIKEQTTDFSSDLSVICQKKKLSPHLLKKENLSQQLSTWIRITRADMVLVLGFSYKIPKDILKLPRLGFYNIHFGKLPVYGGSSPVFWQIKKQEKEGVLTIHQMDENFDTGPIAVEIPFEIKPIYTFGIVGTNYSHIAIQGVFKLLDNLLKNTLRLKPQAIKTPVFLPRPVLKDIIINWQTMKADKILALVKACNPWNRGAIARINGLDVKIIEAKISSAPSKKAGEVIQISANGMKVSCIQNTALDIKILYSQLGYLEGETLNTFGVKEGDVFEKVLF